VAFLEQFWQHKQSRISITVDGEHMIHAKSWSPYGGLHVVFHKIIDLQEGRKSIKIKG
jgi:hypothetical protein